MQLGRHLHELWHHRVGLVVSVLIASLAALWSVGKITLAPPGVKPRVVEVGAASTRALVDSPKSAVLDLDMPATNLQAMTNRGVLVGNLIASDPVRAYIGRRAHIRPELLQVASPVTLEFPRPLESSGKHSTSDVLKSPNAYRLSIQANPTVPIVDVYAEAPTAKTAEVLANAAVEGMQDYLRDLAVRQRIPAERQVHIEQLGRASGGLTNAGVRLKLGILSFLVAFAASGVSALAVRRVRRGWRLASGTRAQRAVG